MKRFLAFLLFVTILVLALTACGKTTTLVKCPFSSTISGLCRFKPGNESMMANMAVPVGLGDYTYVEVTAPDKNTLTATVFGDVWVMGQGTNSLKLLRRGSAAATVYVTVEGADYPINVKFDGYGKP